MDDSIGAFDIGRGHYRVINLHAAGSVNRQHSALHALSPTFRSPPHNDL